MGCVEEARNLPAVTQVVTSRARMEAYMSVGQPAHLLHRVLCRLGCAGVGRVADSTVFSMLRSPSLRVRRLYLPCVVPSRFLSNTGMPRLTVLTSKRSLLPSPPVPDSKISDSSGGAPWTAQLSTTVLLNIPDSPSYPSPGPAVHLTALPDISDPSLSLLPRR